MNSSDVEAACPAWFENYERFHSQHRLQAGTRYLVFRGEQALSGGIGDRVRGMLYTIKAAYALKRVVLFTWADPFEVTNFFVPAGSINWTLQGISLEPGPLMIFNDSDTVQMALNGSVDKFTDKFVTWRHNINVEDPCYKCPTVNSHKEVSCIMRRTLRVTDDIQQRAEQQLVALYGTPKPAYTAVHLRLGGLTGEEALPDYDLARRKASTNQLQSLMSAVACANQVMWGAGAATRGQPILMVTDNHALRAFIQQGNLASIIVAPGMLPVHLALATNQSLKEHQGTIVDFVLLSQATCLVHSMSGFNRWAWIFGGAKHCHALAEACTIGHDYRPA